MDIETETLTQNETMRRAVSPAAELWSGTLGAQHSALRRNANCAQCCYAARRPDGVVPFMSAVQDLDVALRRMIISGLLNFSKCLPCMMQPLAPFMSLKQNGNTLPPLELAAIWSSWFALKRVMLWLPQFSIRECRREGKADANE